MAKYYSINASGERAYRESLMEAAAGGAKVLEYGCGQGSAAFDLAAAGNDVVGIDISPVAIAQAGGEASRLGVADTARFLVMDAERLSFGGDSFDVVCGSGILHHLDVAAAAAEVARVLRPDGTAIFMEPMGHNPIINAYRRRTPDLRTPDEHPLLRSDLRQLENSFGTVEARFATLTALMAVPLSGRRGFGTALRALDRVDGRLLSIPRLAPYAWCCILLLRRPKV